jgi:GNAT superfamily N-acetyltransferase
VARAFGSDAEALLVDRIRDAPEYVPEMALVAVVGGDVAGHVMISGALLRGAAGERPIVMLSPLAVDPAHRRRGIGSALVRAALAVADGRGEPIRPCGARLSIRRRSTGWEAPDPGRSLGGGGPAADAPPKGRHRCLPPGCIPAYRPTTP